jgi:hypothetical protein
MPSAAFRPVVLLLLAVLTLGAIAAAKETPLTGLSARLHALLEQGDFAGLTLTPAQADMLRHPQYGVVADYRDWLAYVRQYRRDLEAYHAYRDLPVVSELCDDPVNVPWRLDDWATRLYDGKPGVDTGLLEATRAWGALGTATPPIPRRVKGREAFDHCANALTAAAAIIDQQALATVPPEQRALLRFVLPWLCRSGGRFLNHSKGSIYYGMEMMFEPNDEFKAGDTATSLSKTPVPAALGGVTGLARYLHALAGQPADGFNFLKETGEQPHFTCRVDDAALARAFALARTVLSAHALNRLSTDLRGREQRGAEAETLPGTTGRLIAVRETLYGKIIVGGSGRNTYTDVDALAIFDLGGDDDYVYTKPETTLGAHGLQVIVDYAGDDVYRTDGVGGPGAGILGINVLIDRAGNDRYYQGLSPLFDPRKAASPLAQPDSEGVKTRLVPFTVLYGNPAKPEEPGVALDAGFAFGAGFLGIGVLVDEGGDDLYLGQKFAFGSAMWHGVGVLHDAGGNDIYAAGLAALGAGVNGAVGLLDDRAGDDHYQCLGTFESAYSAGQEWDNGYMGSGIGFGSSWRAEARRENSPRVPTLGGGLGLAHDAAGNDTYIGSSFGMAASYAGGVGAILDDAGDDTYFVKRGPNGENRSGWSGNHALGNGCHRGVGYLLDRAGNDRYSASGLGGGTAWDMAAGYLLDLGGDDQMTDLHGKGLRGNTGWGAAKGFAVSFHAGGTDRYDRDTLGDAASIGDGYPGHGGNFSFFFDLGPETDAYPAARPNAAALLSGVSMKKEADGKEYPQGIGVFIDGK